MKSIIVLVAFFSLSANANAKSSCQALAEKAAMTEMDKMNSVDLGRKLSKDEKASVVSVLFLDQKNEESRAETGVYQVELRVMEECLDALVVKTNKSNNSDSCRVIEIRASDAARDCG